MSINEKLVPHGKEGSHWEERICKQLNHTRVPMGDEYISEGNNCLGVVVRAWMQKQACQECQDEYVVFIRKV